MRRGGSAAWSSSSGLAQTHRLAALFRAVACHQPHMPLSDGPDGQLNARGDSELPQEGSDVEVRGRDADTQARADLVVGETLNDKRQHGSLLAGKRFALPFLTGRLVPVSNPVLQLSSGAQKSRINPPREGFKTIEQRCGLRHCVGPKREDN